MHIEMLSDSESLRGDRKHISDNVSGGGENLQMEARKTKSITEQWARAYLLFWLSANSGIWRVLLTRTEQES
jgi:hypothetical protein